MAIVTTGTLILIDHSGPTTDPNLATVGEVAVAMNIDSAAVSTATSKMVSTANAQVPDSSSISSASSKAGSAGTQASVADSKSVSGSTTTSVADSKAISVSGNTSIADSKAVSVATATIIPTVGGLPGFQQSGSGAVVRTANGKMAEWYSVKDFGPSAGGVSDDRFAFVNALAAIGTSGLLVPPGTYRIASALTLSCPVMLMPGAMLKPDGGVTITISGAFSCPPVQCFNITASTSAVTVGRKTASLYSEWWGAHAVDTEATTDDSSAITNLTAWNAALASCDGNEVLLLGMYTLSGSLAFSGLGTRSGTFRGLGATHCGFKAITTAPSTVLLNVSGIQGPKWRFVSFQLTGPSFGIVSGTGVSGPANGVEWEDVWFRSLQYGALVQGSYSVFTRCEFEFNGIAMQFDTNPSVESLVEGCAFYQNGTDIYCNGIDMRGTIFAQCSHVNTGQGLGATAGECYDINNCSNLTIRGVVHETQANTTNVIHLRGGSTKIRVSGLQSVGSATTIFLENCADCAVSDWSSDAAATGLYVVNNVTARNVSRNFRIASATVKGMTLDTTGTGNVIDGFDVRGCLVGMALSTEGVEIRNGTITANTTDVTAPLGAAGLGGIHAANITVGTVGDWSPANGKIGWHFDIRTLGLLDVVLSGTPESVVAAPIGSVAHRLDGGATTSLYVKTSGTGNTGWTAK